MACTQDRTGREVRAGGTVVGQGTGERWKPGVPGVHHRFSLQAFMRSPSLPFLFFRFFGVLPPKRALISVPATEISMFHSGGHYRGMWEKVAYTCSISK